MSTTDILDDPNLHLAFPLPYRVLFLVGVGLLAWTTNLHGLHNSDIDAVAALELRTDGYPPRLPLNNSRRPSLIAHGQTSGHVRSLTFMATPHVYQVLYRVLLAYSGICFVSWILYRIATQGDPALADTYGYIPAVTALIMVGLLVLPVDVFFREERVKLTQSIRRCFFSSPNTPILFCDVILADILTSFAKVVGDVWLSLCMIVPGNTLLNPPSQTGLSLWILPTLMSLPYFARFRQCVIEYNLPSNESTRPLFNAVKYATAFPVIYLSAAQSLVVVDRDSAEDEPWHGEYRLFRLWLLSVFVNSIYSFWWDITNDWGFELLKPSSSESQEVPSPTTSPKKLHRPRSKTPLIDRHSSGSLEMDRTFHVIEPKPSRVTPTYGLRRTLLFPFIFYPLLIVVNFVLRMSWSVKLATHLHVTRDGSINIFWLELAEITRRWLWVFIRVEWEVIKKLTEGEPMAKSIGEVLHDAISSRSSSETLCGSSSALD